MEERSQAAPALLMDAEEPLVLVGPPRAIRGEFRLQNPTAAKVFVREPTIRSGRTPGSRAKAKEEVAVLPQSRLVMRRIVMRPMQSRPIPLALDLDPRTPPGTYHAELVINDEHRSVVIHVTEDVALSIEPAVILLPNKPGEKVKRRVFFANPGNVAIPIRSIGTVVLDEELAHCRALRGALSDVAETMEGLDDFLVALGKRYKKQYDTLVLKVQNTGVTLEPGETEAVELTITLPEKLEPRGRYSGYAAVSTSSLPFVIVPD